MPQPRLKLLLGKYPVIRVERTATGFRAALNLGAGRDGFKMIIDCPVNADIREGDLLTLYTEIYSNAKP